MSVSVEIAYEGQLRCKAVHGPSECHVVTDAPVDNHGKGAHFSPTDLVATALGTCTLTLLGIVADRHGISLEGTTVKVEKHMVAEPVEITGALSRLGDLEVLRADPASYRRLGSWSPSPEAP